MMNTRTKILADIAEVGRLTDAGEFAAALNYANALLDFMLDLGLDKHEDYKVCFQSMSKAAEHLTDCYIRSL